jgi:hypothetical protein
MKNTFLALQGKVTNLRLRGLMLRISAIVVLICGLCAGIQFGAVAGVGLAMLMSRRSCRSRKRFVSAPTLA